MRTVFFGSSADQPAGEPFSIPIPLSPEELRVLGCLIEKQFLTPDLYPMTLNALLNACNQKTSREPVTAYGEASVDETLSSLQSKGLASRITGPEFRVPKFREWLGERTGLKVSELGVLCVMMLRGPQTLNELKDRTNRIHQFGDEHDVLDTVDRLMSRQPQQLVVCIGRVSGQREDRYAHLLAGPVDAAQMNNFAPSAVPPVSAAPREDRVAKLEAEVAALKLAVASLEEEFAKFRRQFE